MRRLRITRCDRTVRIANQPPVKPPAKPIVITIAIAPWVKVADFGPAGVEIHRAIVEKFAGAGIQYPAPPVEIPEVATPPLATP